jgi:subtilisin family serine protease
MRPATRTPSALAALAVAVIAVVLAGVAPAAADPEPEVRLLVGWQPHTPMPKAAVVAELVGGEPVERVAAIGLDVVAVPAARAAATLARLRAHPGVAYAEPDRPVEAAATVPTDPLWPQQWGPVLTRTTTAWDTTIGSSSIVIAVLDSGVDAAHPDLAGVLVPGTDVINGDGDPNDDNGHGTAAAGVVAARANNGVGAAGYCWACRVMPVKVLDAAGQGSTSTVAAGVTWAVDRGARVLSLSLSGTATSSAVESAISYARSRGAVVIAAAGNEASTVPNYPAASPGVVSVAASDAADVRASYSNYGPWARLAAPGCHVTPNRGGGYVSFCGTSSATPAVAGIAGLLLSARPATTGTGLESTLTATAQPVGTWVVSGRVDAAAAMASLIGPLPAPAPEPVPVSFERVAGASRIETAVALSRRSRAVAPAVVVARADDYADALAAAPLAATVGGPLLLSARDQLADAASDEVRRLGAAVAYLVGGAAALSPVVEDALRAAGVGRVERIAGANRFDTARLIALRVGGSSAFLTEGANPDPARGWPDAVAVAGLAAQQRRPILLTGRDQLPAETRLALQQLGTAAVTVVGGPVAVSDEAAQSASDPDGDGAAQIALERLAGTDRWHTSTLVADRALAAAATNWLWLATGNDWPDALAAGPAAAASGAVLVLVDGRDLSRSPAAEAWLTAHQTGFREVVVVGGATSLSSLVEARVAELLR